MKITSAAKVGFTVIMLALVFVAIYRGMGWRLPWTKTPIGAYSLTVGFASVKGLNRGADVQLNGNAVGEVVEIRNDGYGGVLVDLNIRTKEPIHEHARFVINRDSIFGSYLVSIEETRSGRMEGAQVGNEARVILGTGLVSEGGLVFRKGEVIGEIISIVPNGDNRSDRITLRLIGDEKLTQDMAFVPFRTASGEPGGLTVHGVLESGAVIDGHREPGPEDLVATADEALREITQQASLIIGQVSLLLEDLTAFIDPEQISHVIETLASEATLIANNIERLTLQLNYMLTESEPHIIGSLENIEGLTGDARRLLADVGEYNTPVSYTHLTLPTKRIV